MKARDCRRGGSAIGWKAAVVLVLGLMVTANAQSVDHFVGAITAITGHTLTVKTDAGQEHQFDVPAEAVLKRIEPGQKSLSAAMPMQFADLAVGDRVLVKLDPAATGGTLEAAQIIAIKAADLAKKQQADRDDWQRRGIAGLVKSVDPATGRIVINTGAGPTAKTVTVKTTPATTLKRYAPGSVRFADATAAPLSDIKPGDQLRARGDHNPDGTEMNADGVVSGTFRSIAGTISSIDTAKTTIELKDLATKKQVTIHIEQDTHLHKIPERMAQMLAIRLKGTVDAGEGHRGGPPSAGGATGGAPGGARWAQNGRGGVGGQMASADPQRFLTMAPTIKITDLQKGEAVMVVATSGATDVNAITLLSGVEPLLEAPAATNLLSNWSMGGGGAEAAAAGPQ